MGSSFGLNIPYLIWAIICVIIIVIIVVFCFVQIRRFLRRNREQRANLWSLYDTPAIPATVLVNSVSDAGARAQHDAVMAELSRRYGGAADAAAQAPPVPQHAWYASEQTQNTLRRQSLRPVEVILSERVLREEQDGGAFGTSGDAAAFGEQQYDSPREGAEEPQRASISPAAFQRNPLARPPPSPQQQQQQRESDVAMLRSTIIHASSPPPTHIDITIRIAANPTPLGVATTSTLAPMHVRRSIEDGRLRLVPVRESAPAWGRSREAQLQQRREERQPPSSSEDLHPYSSGFAAALNAVSRPAFFHTASSWLRGERHGGSSEVGDYDTDGGGAARAASTSGRGGGAVGSAAVKGYCCDEMGKRLSLRQVNDAYGSAEYLPRVGEASAIHTNAVAEEERQVVKEESASVFLLNSVARHRSDGGGSGDAST